MTQLRLWRLHRVLALLETKDDYVPLPRAHEFGGRPGPAAGRRVPCGCAHLKGDRLVASRRCLLCGGSGWRLRISRLDGAVDDDGGRDDRGLAFDEYTYEYDLAEAPRRTRLFGYGQARTMTRHELEGELARLRRLERVRSGVIAGERFGWERARRARDRRGSYVELERALEHLRDVDEETYELVVHAYVEGRYGRPPRLSPALSARLVRGLALLDRTMPSEILVPDWLEQKLRSEKRQATVEELLEAGWKTSRIARELGITQEAVKRVVKRLPISRREPEPSMVGAARGEDTRPPHGLDSAGIT